MSPETRVVPPASSSGAASSVMTDSAPASFAAIAADRPAPPMPMTTTSASVSHSAGRFPTEAETSSARAAAAPTKPVAAMPMPAAPATPAKPLRDITFAVMLAPLSTCRSSFPHSLIEKPALAESSGTSLFDAVSMGYYGLRRK